MLMLSLRSDIQVQAFQKDAIDKDIFRTHLREAYIMMILCDTEIRTYVLLKKGQTAAARKKVGLPRFSCGTSKIEG